MFGLARRGSTIGFHLLWNTVELAIEYSSLFIIIVITLIFYVFVSIHFPVDYSVKTDFTSILKLGLPLKESLCFHWE